MEDKFEYHEDTKELKDKYSVNKKGEKDGVYVEFSKTGTPKIMLTYENGKLNGEYIEYTKFGKIMEIGTYKEGVKEGEVTRIIANGELKGIQKNGVMIGESYFSSKHSDGKVKDKLILRDDRIVSAKMYDRSGNLTKVLKRSYEPNKIIDSFINYREEYIEKGTMINLKLEGIFQKYLTENNSLYQEINYKDGKPHGEFKEYYQNGNLKEKVNYINGLEEGIKTEYLDNGLKDSEILYKNGVIEKLISYRDNKIEGEVTYNDGFRKSEKIFYDDLSLKTTLLYKENNEVEWKGYYKNGNLQFENNLKDNLFNGEQKKYYENGNLMEVINYIIKNGKEAVKDGVSKEFYENGRLKEEKIYKNGELVQSKKNEKSKVNEKPLKTRERTRSRGNER